MQSSIRAPLFSLTTLEVDFCGVDTVELRLVEESVRVFSLWFGNGGTSGNASARLTTELDKDISLGSGRVLALQST